MRNIKGFTLIELLIVIGVLGILAAGLLAAVDPFEQLKKGRDTNRRNIAVELNNALIRYYATHGSLPWSGASPICAMYTNGSAPVTMQALNNGNASSLDATGCIQPLVDDGELKQDYIAGVGTGDIAKYFIYSATGVDLSICYEPESKSFYNDTATKWANSGASGFTDASATTCTVANKKVNLGTGVCFWCAK